MNPVGFESGNPSITANRTLPWLQDVDANQDQETDNFLTSWAYEYRDVVIVDGTNRPVDVYNLTVHDLKKPENYATMRQKLIDAAEAEVAVSWTNPVEPLDVNNDADISPLDVLLILNELNTVGSHELVPPGSGGPPAFLDTSGDGFVSPLDALLVVNHLNSVSVVKAVPAAPASSAATAEGEPSSAANRTASADVSLVAAAIDAVFSDESRSEKATTTD